MGIAPKTTDEFAVVSDKHPPPFSSSPSPAPPDQDDGAVGLGLKLQSSGSPPPPPPPLMMHHHHHHRPSSSPAATAPPPNEVTLGNCRTIYRYDMGIPPANPNNTVSSNGHQQSFFPSPPVSVRNLQQPFDITPSNPLPKYPGMAANLGMGMGMGYPFTAAQWKELERQAMIYKYMVASVPVPYELLLSLTQNHHSVSHPSLVVGGGCYGGGGGVLRFGGKQDPEPGRCKRTDGKKWRCSRDVAPNQKYCERHMHRGRPRSRKHVEIASSSQPNPQTLNKKTRLDHQISNQNPNPNPNPTPLCSTPKVVLGSTIVPNHSHPSFLDAKHVQNRVGLDWRMGGGEAEDQWQNLMQGGGGSIYDSGENKNGSVFQQDCFGGLNLFSYTDFGASQDFLGTCDISSLDKEPPPRGFIDAWSNNDGDNKNICSTEDSSAVNGNLSPSSLTLSMAMALGNAIDGDLGQIQMGSAKPAPSSVSWGGGTAALGGPLAEVLRPSYCSGGDGDPISPPATTVSSPSGVLQRTMLSLSDSSVCNSPTTLAAPTTATPEIVAFQWFT